ncbi:UNKNOWN [Stylonychia lemnae]|uniref:Protein transport protein Sec61 subunit beta n=1 Tax=Stylonychia lemnae TaxID=5949 RepID=A0A078B3V3_STYLE|nr:UNKNOWN [Stylonychia lemnae]|eukprot:CDW89169.1 UNKNOWN [Stylonychia lemnae]
MARSKTAPQRSLAGQAQGRPQSKQNQLSFFSEESQGLKLSPKTVLVISLLYMGVVVLLHIFGKVKGGTATGQKDL